MSTSTPALSRLALALTGASPLTPHQSPYVSEEPSPPPTTPEPETAPPARSGEPPAPIEGLPANPVRHRHEPRPLTAWFADDPAGEPYPRTQSMRAWAQELGLQYATLRWRVEHGWPDMEALGLLPHTRDYGAEQRPAGDAGAAVLVVEHVDRSVVDSGSVDSAAEGGAAGSTWRVLSRAEVAEHLGIKLTSVPQRLRQYRTADGSQAVVELSTLAARGRRRRTS